jgi:rhodanese-related sulfurtransferase
MNKVTAQALAKWLEGSERSSPVLLDVREPWEVEIWQIEGALSMPMQTVPNRLSELDLESPIASP